MVISSQVIRRLFEKSKTSSGPVHPFNQLIIDWFAVNYWTTEHFSIITQGCCSPEDTLTTYEVARMFSTGPRELTPKHFRALSNVFNSVKDATSKKINSSYELYSLFTSLPCLNEDARLASWWFGAYCSENWTNQQVRKFDPPPISITNLGSALPAFMRKHISQTGCDPVTFIEERSNVIYSSYMPKSAHSFGDWMLGYKQGSSEESRVYVTIAISLLNEIGVDYPTIADLVNDVVSAKKPLALKASETKEGVSKNGKTSKAAANLAPSNQ